MKKLFVSQPLCSARLFFFSFLFFLRSVCMFLTRYEASAKLNLLLSFFFSSHLFVYCTARKIVKSPQFKTVFLFLHILVFVQCVAGVTRKYDIGNDSTKGWPKCLTFSLGLANQDAMLKTKNHSFFH